MKMQPQPGGERVAEIGPLPIEAGRPYKAQRRMAKPATTLVRDWTPKGSYR